MGRKEIEEKDIGLGCNELGVQKVELELELEDIGNPILKVFMNTNTNWPNGMSHRKWRETKQQLM